MMTIDHIVVSTHSAPQPFIGFSDSSLGVFPVVR
jgi:hypothetical protein